MSIVCRICGTEIPVDQDLCPNCGRLKVNFPAILPDKLKNIFDEEKIRYEQDVKDREDTNSSRSAAVKDLEMQVAQQKQQLEEVRKKLEEANKKIESDINKHHDLLEQLSASTKRADAAEERIAELTKEIQGIQIEKDELLEQIKAHDVEQPIAFLVQMQGDDISAIYNIYEGENSFGYMKPHDRHQQVICNAHVADDHFTIRATTSTDSKGHPRTKFYVTPKDGNIYRSSEQANRISSEVEFDKNESVFIDDVKFTLVANKKIKIWKTKL